MAARTELSALAAAQLHLLSSSRAVLKIDVSICGYEAAAGRLLLIESAHVIPPAWASPAIFSPYQGWMTQVHVVFGVLVLPRHSLEERESNHF